MLFYDIEKFIEEMKARDIFHNPLDKIVNIDRFEQNYRLNEAKVENDKQK